MISSLTPRNIEEMRQLVVERFASLFESQTRTHLFAHNVGELVHHINAEISFHLANSLALIGKSSLRDEERRSIENSLQSAINRNVRLDRTVDMLLGERERQWQQNGDHLRQILLEFYQTTEKLMGTLIEKDLFERQSHVLESIILSHEKVSQWKAFVQEILSGFRSIFPFNFFFIAFSEEHGLSLFIYYLGDYSEEVKISVRKTLSREMMGKLDLPLDAPLDIEEFHIPVAERHDSIEHIEMIAVSVSIPELQNLNLAGLLGVAYGSVQKLSTQEATVIRSILAVMVMVVGSSKVLSKTLAELEYYSTHDPLTGLHNRRYFNDMLENEISRSERYQREFSVLMLDLDDFKDVNDAYGHPCGDQVLKLVAESMNGMVRKGDLVTRIGGDEFAIVLTETAKEVAVSVAEKIREDMRGLAFEAPTTGKVFHITSSIGVVTYPGDAKNASDLMTGVDLGLYRAKEMGKNSVCVLEGADDRIQENRGSRNYVETLRVALKEGRVIPFYQPIYDCQTGSMYAHETLARLIEPGGNTLSAASFIETIERYGLGRELDRSMINRALTDLKVTVDQGNELHLFINLSAQEIQGRGVLGFAEQLCDEHKIRPQLVTFEILERDAVSDMTHMRKFLQDLSKKGFSFALDDFGSGYNSFHYLRELRFDYVKLDGAFVRNILNSHVDHTLIHNLVRLCQGLGILTVAEFVESQEVLGELKNMGVDYAQGYFLGMPLPTMQGGGVMISFL